MKPNRLLNAMNGWCWASLTFSPTYLTIDNLIKGASGQVVQNMNVMCGFDEKMGLL